MKTNKGWSRRDFVQIIGTAALGSRGLAATLLPSGQSSMSSRAAFLYVGCAGGKLDGIEVLAAEGSGWRSIQRVQSAQPTSLAVGADGRTLYAANQIGLYRGLPMGTVESYTIGGDGRLTLLNRQELSLSATMPRHLAVSPNGRSLAVTAQGGGVYNVMPIAEDGSVGRATGILKVTGDTDGRRAQPRMATFDRAGRIVGADQGTGRLRVFAANDDNLITHSVSKIENGSPRHIAMHHDGDALYVAHDDSIECYGYDQTAGHILELRQRLTNAVVANGATALAIHPSGKLLLACDAVRGVSSWKIGADKALQFAGSHASELGRLDAIEIARDGASVITINNERGVISGAKIDTATGSVSEAQMLARVDSPRSFAVVYS